METHIAFLALRAEAAALVDLTKVSTSTTNEERKRKSASQLLRHSAKRLLTAVGAPHTSRNASPPSPRQVGGGEMSPSAAKGMRGGASSLAIAAALPNAECPMPNAAPFPNAECPMPIAPSQPNALSFSDREIDVLMVTLARHFNIDITSDGAEPEPNTMASSAGPA